MSAEQTGTHASPGAPAEPRVSVLDEALWSRFDENGDLADFSRVWLALQIRQIASVAGAVVVVNDGSGGFMPVAKWPQDDPPSARLAEAVEKALEQGTPTVASGRAIAVPLTIDGELVGAAGLDFDAKPAQPTEQVRQLRWGTGWLAAAARAALMGKAAEDRRRMSSILDLVGAALDARTFNGSCLAAVNLLARETGCETVGLGLVRGRALRLEALSDVADFRLNTGRTRAIESAMFEAADQEGTVLYPPRPDQGFTVDLAHAELHRDGASGELLTVPMFAEGRIAGALHFQKPGGESFDVADLLVAEGATAILGPLLIDKRRLDRSAFAVFRDVVVSQLVRLFGPEHYGRKVALSVIVVLAVFFAVASDIFRVRADAEVQGRVVRSVTAPFDGNIAAQFARAGDRIREGEPLARLDETDHRIELLRAQTDINRFEAEYDRALAERKAPDARIASASLAEARARAELVAAQLARAELRAPFDAMVTSGDLSQSLGAAVRRGEELFQIAPLESFRVRVEVEETDLDEIEVGQTGTLVLASLPGEEFGVRITRITPQMEARDGLNVALVEAELLDAARQVRPGMRGIAKIEIEERLLIDIWMRPIVDWARLAVWRWTP